VDKDQSFKKGTTTLGLVCKDGVVMAADKIKGSPVDVWSPCIFIKADYLCYM